MLYAQSRTCCAAFLLGFTEALLPVGGVTAAWFQADMCAENRETGGQIPDMQIMQFCEMFVLQESFLDLIEIYILPSCIDDDVYSPAQEPVCFLRMILSVQM